MYVQSSELSVLKSLENALKNNFFVVNVHVDYVGKYINQPLAMDVIEYLNKYRYYMIGTSNPINYKDKMISSNITFLKKTIPKSEIYKCVKILISLNFLEDAELLLKMNSLKIDKKYNEIILSFQSSRVSSFLVLFMNINSFLKKFSILNYPRISTINILRHFFKNVISLGSKLIKN